MFFRCLFYRGRSGLNVRVRSITDLPPGLNTYHRNNARTFFRSRKGTSKPLPEKPTEPVHESAVPPNSKETPGHSSAFTDVEERIAQSAAAAVIEQLKKGNFYNSGKASSFIPLMLVVVACGLTVLYMESLHSSVIEATGNAAGSLLYSNAFHELSISFVMGIVEELLDSTEMHDMLRDKVHHVLRDSAPLFKDIIIGILQEEEVANMSFKFSESIADRLCKDPEVIEMVGQLLLDAIKTDTAVNGAAEWFVDLTQRDDTRDAVAFLLSDRILSDAKLQLEAINFCKTVTTQFLNDKETMQESADFIKSLLNRPSVQSHLSQTLVDIVKQSIYPRWLINPEGQKLLRLKPQIHGAGSDSVNAFMPSRFI